MLRCALLLIALALTSSALAEPLRVDASAERMRVDGSLREWRGARFAELGSDEDGSARYALATADGGLYIAAEVRDERLVSGEQGDAVVLVLAMPDGRGFAVSELWLHPGESGRSKAIARLGTPLRTEPRVKVVEGPRESGGGYAIEAFVPWSLIRGAEIWEQGRGALRLVDVDAPGRPAERTLASAQAKTPGELPVLALGAGQNDLLGSFLAEKKLSGIAPRYDFRADVAGDAQPERIVIVSDFIVVYGPGYKRGETYGYFVLPYTTGGGLKNAEVRDLTGDGRSELAIAVRQGNDLGVRELWVALDLAESGISQLFAIELKKEAKGGFIDNTLAISSSKPPRIEVKPGRAQGLDARTFEEASAGDAQAILLPWGDIAARTYAFDGAKFAVVEEKRRVVAATAPTPVVGQPTIARAEVASASASAPSEAKLLDLFRDQQKLPRQAKPSRTLAANLFGSPAPERLALFGSLVAITGADVAGGAGYLAYGIPVTDARDVLEVRTAEVTGDGAEELLVRTRQPLTGAERAERELLLVLRADASGKFARVLTVEVARRTAEGSIENRVRVAPGALAIEPGAAKGWSAETYPFAPEATGGALPLLLPWRDRAVRYTLRGSSLVAAP